MKVTVNTFVNIIIMLILSFFISSIALLVMLFVPERVFISHVYVFNASIIVWLISFVFIYELPDLTIEVE